MHFSHYRLHLGLSAHGKSNSDLHHSLIFQFGRGDEDSLLSVAADSRLLALRGVNADHFLFLRLAQ